MTKFLPSAILSILIFFAAAPPSSAADVLEFDVTGIKLGMSLSEVEASAAARQENRERVNPNEYAGVLQIIFVTDAEEMLVKFVPLPDGVRAASTEYKFFGPGSTEDMTESVLAKYGEPDHINRSLHVWGDELNPFHRQEPSLEYTAGGTGFRGKRVGALTLRDPELRQKSQDEIKKAAEALGGKKPSF